MERPEEGIACHEQWLLNLLQQHDFEIERVQRGNWAHDEILCISQDYVIASCSAGDD
jgi:hypothetical protein